MQPASHRDSRDYVLHCFTRRELQLLARAPPRNTKCETLIDDTDDQIDDKDDRIDDTVCVR